jgi:hypothetical protein
VDTALIYLPFESARRTRLVITIDRSRMTERVIDTTFNVREVSSETPWEIWWPALGLLKLLAYKPEYALDWHAISDFCDFIELRAIPEIKLKSDCDGDIGTTMYPNGKPAHVDMNELVLPRAASIAISHEIYHCKQHEERGYAWPNEVHINPYKIGWEAYWNHPTERQAREYEEYGLYNMLVKEL